MVAAGVGSCDGGGREASDAIGFEPFTAVGGFEDATDGFVEFDHCESWIKSAGLRPTPQDKCAGLRPTLHERQQLHSALLEELGYYAGPAGLVRGSQARNRYLRGRTRRTIPDRASGGRNGNARSPRWTGLAPFSSRRKMRVRRREISTETSHRFMYVPEPVGHSTLKSGPR